MARQRTSIGFKLAVHGDSGAGGLVAPLPCTAYFGKLARLQPPTLSFPGHQLFSYLSLATGDSYVCG